MHIAIVNLTSGGLSGGYRKYIRELVPRLRAHSAVSAVSVIYPPAFAGALSAEESSFIWQGRNGLRDELRSLAPDIVFFPTARIADCAGLPTAVMVRNMEPLAAPFRDNPWSVRARNVARHFVARRSCERATRVIAVSNYVADYLTKRWSIPARQVGLV